MPDTVILKNEDKLIRHLLGFLNNRITPLKLRYRASSHGWSVQKFRKFCEEKVGTVVLVKVGNYIFGGYTDQTWHCWKGKNLTKCCLYNSHKSPNGIAILVHVTFFLRYNIPACRLY